ncbi:MAG: LysR family transcriptional regulator [Alphaproteobacteria bacterium 62-8]|nr:MAG: LysR family transcriptional regulator [Alphaproteobacteria bacterium 62-8]
MRVEPIGVGNSVDIRHLRYVIAAADHHSLRRAAEALRLKESTLSRCVRELEQRLEVLLFERSRAGVRPTAAGVSFLTAARRIVREVDAMARMAKRAGRGEVGRLTVGFYTSLSAGNLRATLLEYVKRFPQVEICLYQDSRAGLFTAVDNGALDIAIVTGEPNGQHRRSMALWSERVMVALPEGHPLAAQEIVSWTDLKGETFLLARFDLGQDFRDLLMMKLASPGDRPKIVQYEVNGETIKSLVGAGLGVSITCDAYLGVSYAGVAYREARDGNGPWRLGYRAHWAADNLNPALGSFLKLLRERYPALPEPE